MVTSLSSQLAGMVEQVTNLQQQQQPAASHGCNDSANESAVKQRLRKIELTVAGQGRIYSSSSTRSYF